MRPPSRTQSSVIAATILSVLTATVFAISRNQGPESAIMRYHEELAKFRDPGLLFKSLTENSNQAQSSVVRESTIDPPTAQGVADFHVEILRLLRESRSVRVGSVNRAGRLALVDVVYASTNGVMTVRYALQKDRYGWRIDTVETLHRTRSLMGMGEVK